MKLIQLGNLEQCIDNGVEGWEYAFGIQPKGSKLLGSQRWQCSNDRYKPVWNVRPEHATSFKLVLIFS